MMCFDLTADLVIKFLTFESRYLVVRQNDPIGSHLLFQCLQALDKKLQCFGALELLSKNKLLLLRDSKNFKDVFG